jgi:starch phosphorylase
VLADYQAYVSCQEQVSALWRNPEEWTRKAILNTARMGKFSSDRSICNYSELVWKVKPITVFNGQSSPADVVPGAEQASLAAGTQARSQTAPTAA